MTNSVTLTQDLSGEALQTKAFINGQFVESLSKKTLEILNPRDSSVLANVTACDEKDVDAAVLAARHSFELGTWRGKTMQQRKKTLLHLADLLEQNASLFAALESADTGKPLHVARHDDIPGAIETLRWYAEAADKLYDESIQPTPDRLALITREPIGVVGAVIAWNFPLTLLIWKIAPALMLGNSLVLKPSEKTPLSALKLCELTQETDLPQGVLNILPGLGETAGQAIGRHPDIDCVTFTGSTETGRKFQHYAGESNMKRVWLECGGKSANILLPNYQDLSKFAETSAAEIFYNQGEVCSALSRMIIPHALKDQVCALMKDQADLWYPHDPLNPESRMGAIIDETQFKKIMHHIDLAQKEGATLLCGGKKASVVKGGHYVEPTIFTDVTPEMTLAQEEVFGPVLAIMGYETIDEAIHIANSTRYGLAACLWTHDIKAGHHYSRQLKAGSVTLNGTSMVSPYTPFGGYKQSGIGRDLSLHAFDKYSEIKSTVLNLD